MDIQTAGLAAAWTAVLTFVPKFLAFLLILAAGYYVSKWLGKLLHQLLLRVGFERALETGGIKQAMQQSGHDASAIAGTLLFYTIFLFVLHMAFGVFGPNPISDLLSRVIAFLPFILVAIVITVLSASIASAVRRILGATLGNLSYGQLLANVAAGAIVVVGVFAALDELRVAPAIVTGLFYAALAIIVGSAVVAIGGGGIIPMRAQWEKALNRIVLEAPRVQQEAHSARLRIEQGGQPASSGPSETFRRRAL